MKFIFCTLLLWSFCTYAQNDHFVQIDYQYSKNLYTLKERLIANNKSSVYIKFPIDTLIESVSDIQGKVEKNNKKIKVNQMRFFAYSNNDTIISEMSGYENKKYLVYDKLPKQDWQIESGQTKVIAGYECILAKLEFRGSEFEAYFTPEIPIPFGPYKFQGLSGAILELKMVNSRNLHQWVATRITFKNKKNVKDNFNIDNHKRIVVTQQEYIEEIEGYMMDIFKKYGARESERGVTVRSEMSRHGIEKIYEWETTDEKK